MLERLSAWQSFYVMLGSSAAALIGLQFVVLTLLANTRRRASAASIAAFGTPTVVQLGGALVLSAVMSAPWPSLLAVSVVLGTCGAAGLGYGTVILYRIRHQKAYVPEGEDWFWYVIAPPLVYAALTVAALALRAAPNVALFVVGGAALGLLALGIHNSWDAVTYHVVHSTNQADTETKEF